MTKTDRYGKPVSLACAEGRHSECAEDYTTCNCTVRGGHKTPHAYAEYPPDEGLNPPGPRYF
jgi:hypothetical protein